MNTPAIALCCLAVLAGPAVAQQPSSLQPFTGMYQSSGEQPTATAVYLEDGRLYEETVTAAREQLLPDPANKRDSFFFFDSPFNVFFTRNTAGAITGFTITLDSTGRVLAFFGAKGGVGTTTLAVHLAMHLVRQHNRRTLIIDHKHQLGHVALYLGLKATQYHFDELLRNVDRLDTELLNGYAIRHSSGLVVIASPDISSKYYECKQDEIERVMDFLRR